MLNEWWDFFEKSLKFCQVVMSLTIGKVLNNSSNIIFCRCSQSAENVGK